MRWLSIGDSEFNSAVLLSLASPFFDGGWQATIPVPTPVRESMDRSSGHE